MTDTIVVIIFSKHPTRFNEALRAALGLSLRGRKIHVFIETNAYQTMRHHESTIKALNTLKLLEHTIVISTINDTLMIDACHAHATEIWT